MASLGEDCCVVAAAGGVADGSGDDVGVSCGVSVDCRGATGVCDDELPVLFVLDETGGADPSLASRPSSEPLTLR